MVILQRIYAQPLRILLKVEVVGRHPIDTNYVLVGAISPNGTLVHGETLPADTVQIVADIQRPRYHRTWCKQLVLQETPSCPI